MVVVVQARVCAIMALCLWSEVPSEPGLTCVVESCDSHACVCVHTHTHICRQKAQVTVCFSLHASIPVEVMETVEAPYYIVDSG